MILARPDSRRFVPRPGVRSLRSGTSPGASDRWARWLNCYGPPGRGGHWARRSSSVSRASTAQLIALSLAALACPHLTGRERSSSRISMSRSAVVGAATGSSLVRLSFSVASSMGLMSPK